MSGSSNLEFQNGFEGAFQTSKQQSTLGGDGIHSQAKQMFGHGEDVMGTTKGAFGMQIGNSATANSDVLMANAKMHHVSSEGNSQFAQQASHHHEGAAEGAGRVVATGQGQAGDIHSRITPV